ncbi:platelet activating factor acetylhydrolase 1b catalytic subunit 3 [Phyllostomus discolor]|uniref:Platelet-activating factor acetylhydrolase IB subunit alpha1 n=1 Tax=Phyllostomus discolor TaxID=89673 RepID=A0A833YQY5_9CHIR|nr:platelet activating factor acetylhydrolase 1b catalytic subunit 3 [Phyllostomus discolor]
MSGENPASKPTPVQDVQGDGRWMSLHHRFVADSKDKEPEVVFIGDSLVQLMHQCEIWRELFSPLHALNFGIGGDGTQHVLWRLENGELEHIRPKIVVVWVGTNNHGHTAEQVAGGIKAIVQLVNQRQPQARVVVLVRVWESGKGRMAVFRDPLRCNHSWHGSGQLGTEQWLSSKISH